MVGQAGEGRMDMGRGVEESRGLQGSEAEALIMATVSQAELEVRFPLGDGVAAGTPSAGDWNVMSAVNERRRWIGTSERDLSRPARSRSFSFSSEVRGTIIVRATHHVEDPSSQASSRTGSESAALAFKYQVRSSRSCL